MRFLTECKADATADLVYHLCPNHLLEPMDLIKDLQPGQVLKNLTDYDGTLQDISAWCAIGVRPGEAQGSLVFNLNRNNGEEKVAHVISHLTPAVMKLRSFSPVWRRKMAEAAGVPR